MPGPCDPGSPRELQDSTNTLGGLSSSGRGSRGERSKGHWAALLSPALCSACVLSVSPEPPGAQSSISKAACSPPKQTLGIDSPHGPESPQITKGLSRSSAQHLTPASLLCGVLASKLRLAFPAAWDPQTRFPCPLFLGRRPNGTHSCS